MSPTTPTPAPDCHRVARKASFARQAIWLARSAGGSMINANCTEACASDQPRPLFLILFSATVEVLP